ncbi:trigger factor-related chaperone [Mycoplasma crocodyli]|uniref:Trigger factor n=1 Tax=Mycoplasma crocodyli (strain ATCC 51981 / MP145) TaxID=512564 RepID=D5E6G9_MYCCM|nr:hypothetical protein [Mycoplasma crocodyli]ADE19531.1 hypothetical protein MCRO_0765 [Mycoplasma crocodyli MP145]
MKITQEKIEFKTQGDEWILTQKKALDYLETLRKEKIVQEDILEFATNKFLNDKLTEFIANKAKKENKFYRDPMLIDKKVTAESLEAQLLIFYYDDVDFTIFERETKIPFLQKDNKEMIENFTKMYMLNYSFEKEQDKIDEKTSAIQMDLLDENDKLISSGSKLLSNNPLYKTIYAKKSDIKKGDILIMDKKSKVKINKIFTKSIEPITKDNVANLNVPEIKTLDDAKRFVAKIANSQFVRLELLNYKRDISFHFSKLILSSELLISDHLINALKTEKTEMVEKAIKDKKISLTDEEKQKEIDMLVSVDISEGLLEKYFYNKFVDTITNKELEEEIKFLKHNPMLNTEINLNEIALSALIDIKVALHYLKLNNKKLHDEIIENF